MTSKKSHPNSPTGVPNSGSNNKAAENFCGILLTGQENYHKWKRRMIIWLQHYGLWDAKSKLPVEGENSSLFYITSNLSPTVDETIASLETGREVWVKLKKDFDKATMHGKIAHITRLANFSYSSATKQDDVNELVDIAKQLKAANGNKNTINIDELITLYAIAKLPDDYDALRTVIITSKTVNVSTIDEVRDLIIDTENAKKNDANSKPTALLTPVEKPAKKHKGRCFGDKCWICHPHLKPTCSLCRQEGLPDNHREGTDRCRLQRLEKQHKTTSQPQINIATVESENKSVFEIYNEDEAQNKDDSVITLPVCPYKGSEGPMFAASARSDETASGAIVCAFYNNVNASNFADTYHVDSGATDHMSPNQNMLNGYQRRVVDINTANSEAASMRSAGVGSIQLGKVRLRNVLHVPNVRSGLISTSALADDGYATIFRKQDCLVIPQATLDAIPQISKNVMMRATRDGGLYSMRIIPATALAKTDGQPDPATTKPKLKSASINDLHRKFGHIDNNIIRHMINYKLINVKLNADKEIACEDCIRAKHQRLPFPDASNSRASKVGDLIHSDLTGPITPTTLNGNKYLLMFTDDYSRFTTGFYIKHKSETLTCWRIYAERVKNISGSYPRIIRSDNGREYKNNEFDMYLKSIGTERQLTVPYTPEQNGVSERLNKTIFGRARAMLIDANLPHSFWGEATNTAIFLKNRITSTANPDKTPYELWYNRKPSVIKLVPFGTTAYAHIPKEKRSKLDDRAEKTTMVGYDNESKAYRLYSIETGKVIISRDVTFLESKETVVDETYPQTHVPYHFGSSKTTCTTIDSDQASHEETETIEEHEEAEATDEPAVDDPEPASNETEVETQQVETPPSNETEVRPMSRRVEAHRNITKRGETIAREYDLMQVDIPVPKAVHDIDSSINPNNIVEGKRNRAPVQRYANLTIQYQEEPKSYYEAINSFHAAKWKVAMLEESNGLEENKTWEFVILPANKHAIGCKWVYKIKYDENGEISRYKARLCVKGYTQIEGIDYFESWAPTAKLNSLRAFLSISASKDLEIHNMDAVQAFIKSDLKEEIYMEIPDGYELPPEQQKLVDEGHQVVLRLRKSLYGLKQAAHEWNKNVDTKLRAQGFKPTQADPCIYIHEDQTTMIAVYVDDFIIAAPKEKLQNVKGMLKQQWEMTDLGELRYALNIEVHRNRKERTITLCQRSKIARIIKQANMEHCKPVITPQETTVKLSKNMAPQDQKQHQEMLPIPFQSIIGSLQNIAITTRPDISSAVSIVSRFIQNPGMQHWKALKRILRYLKGTSNLGLTLGGKYGMALIGYADADWAGDIDTRNSTSGYCFKLQGATITWQSKLQRTTALSSCEAEYMALSSATQESIWLRRLLKEMGNPQSDPTPLYEDNQGAIELVKNNRNHGRTKHIDVRHHFIRSHVENDEIKIYYIPTEDQIADIFTKALPVDTFLKHRDALGLVPIPEDGPN